MNILWLTDIHINFLNDPQIARFLKRLRARNPDVVLISGDLGDALTVAPFLTECAHEIDCPVLFVLGNHDFYHGSIKSVRAEIGELTRAQRKLVYLNLTDVVSLSEEIGVVGHDSWADGRCGDFFGSAIGDGMNDFMLIDELRLSTPEKRLKVMQGLANEAVEHFHRVLPKALHEHRRVIVLTHVPPFEGATWHRGAISSPEWLPFFSSKVVGDALLGIIDRYPDREVTVLCGHTHSSGVYRPRSNMTVFAGVAKYGAPRVQGVAWGFST